MEYPSLCFTGSFLYVSLGQQLFILFNRVSVECSRKSYGLGIYICKTLVVQVFVVRMNIRSLLIYQAEPLIVKLGSDQTPVI